MITQRDNKALKMISSIIVKQNLMQIKKLLKDTKERVGQYDNSFYAVEIVQKLNALNGAFSEVMDLIDKKMAQSDKLF